MRNQRCFFWIALSLLFGKELSAQVISVPLASSSNLHTILDGSVNRIAANNELNTVIFIHRSDTSIFPSDNDGYFRYDISYNGGTTWLLNQGVLNPSANDYSHAGRYPNVVIHNPISNTNPNNAYLGYMGSWLPHGAGGAWDGLFTGVARLDNDTSTFTENILTPNNGNVNIARSLCNGAPGVFWAVDWMWDEVDILGILIYKGVWDQINLDIAWSVDSIIAPFDRSYDGTAYATSLNIGFDPSGQFGWIGFNGDITAGGSQVFNPSFYYTQNGGNSWLGPVTVILDSLPEVIDSLTVGTSVPKTAAFDADMVVDINGYVHYLTVTGFAGSGQSYSIATPNSTTWAGNVLYDITNKPLLRSGWNALIIDSIWTFRGEFSVGVSEDNRPQASCSPNGKKIFFSWLDSDPFIAQDGSNTLPNFKTRGLDVENLKLTPVINWTENDVIWSGAALFASMSPGCFESSGNYVLPTVFAQLNVSGSDMDPASFHYIRNIMYNDSDFTIRVNGQLSVNPKMISGSPCGGGLITVDARISGSSEDYSINWTGNIPVHYPNSSVTTIKIPVTGNFSFTVTVIDNILGDTATQTIDINADCVYISGTVYNDPNHNCQQDAGDLGVPNVLVDITPGGGVYTNSIGNFYFIVDSGAYTVESVLPFYYALVCPISNSHVIALDSTGIVSPYNDFSLENIPYRDLRVSLACQLPRPGRIQVVSFTVFSSSSSPVNGYVEFSLDSRLTYVAFGSTPPDSIDSVNNILYWNFSGNPHFSRTFTFNAQIPPPPTVNSGDVITHSVKVYPITGDNDTLNNSASCSSNVINSYDPNDKTVSPKGIGTEGYIFEHDTLMYYTIRFQNTGTDTAFNVVIMDTLDSNLDYATFQKGTASHPYTVHFEEDNIVVFTFDNILLPDSNVNEPGSNGHVTYYIEHKNNLPFGATISNSAAIYFDFNAPVITNTVSNKIFDPVRVREVHPIADNINVYPNPNDGNFTVRGKAKIGTDWKLELYTLAGKRLFSQLVTEQKELEVSFNSRELSQGIYLLKVENRYGTTVRKIVIH